jgi:hypothetical protein
MAADAVLVAVAEAETRLIVTLPQILQTNAAAAAAFALMHFLQSGDSKSESSSESEALIRWAEVH